MYFPDDMNFQYFFFSTYIGDFLQVIPVALLACIMYAVYKKRKFPSQSILSMIPPSLFVGYLAALLALTLFSEMLGDAYYVLFYHRLPWPVGEGGYQWFSFIYNFEIRFTQGVSAENLGNIMLFLPFGILYPLFRPQSTWIRTLLMGIATSFIIENIQPFMDRSFDINDIILNSVGVAVSTVIFFSLRRLFGKRRHR